MHYDLFLSYSRVDNTAPVNSAGHGWVRAFVEALKARHASYSGRELRIFFDEQSIEEGVDWRRRLGEGIRQSRLFLAFLSPNYITSRNCLWEWEEYLRREHSAARGDDGLTPIYFVRPADLRLGDDQAIAEWLAAMEQKYPWFKARAAQLTPEAERLARPFATDLSRRNKTPNLELQPWFDEGPEVLRELDAAARSLDAKQAPRDPASDLRTLAERLAGLDRHIARRLDRIQLADLAPGNIPRSHAHFVGRHRELSLLHTIMLTGGPQSGGRGMGGRGMIAAAFAPGGLGKTALARQYAHAYAEYYAAGGTWELGCEGGTELGAVLLRLADSPAFQNAAVLRFDPATQRNEHVREPLRLSDEDRADYTRAAQAVLGYLNRLTQARVAVLKQQLGALPDRHCPAHELPELQQPRALLLLDNVDHVELLSAIQLALLPAAEWLELIVTTRLDPASFGADERAFAYVEVGVLPLPDALRLLADFQPGHRFASAAEEDARVQIATALGGWTIAIEIAAAIMGDSARKHDPAPASRFLAELKQNGLAWVDDLATRPAYASQQRHRADQRENRVGTLIRWSLDRLSAPGRSAIQFASLLMPSEIPLEWLRVMTSKRHPDIVGISADDLQWRAVWAELRGLRLLAPAREAEVDERGLEQIPALVSIHRLVAQHVAAADINLDGSATAVDGFFTAIATLFEQQVGQGDDLALRAQHPWLRDQLEFLIAAGPPTPTLLQSAQVAADFEGKHGSLVRAMALTARILAAKDALAVANPDSAMAARDVSVSLNKLGGFLALRGLPGDAEQALKHYQRSLTVSEGLLAANPDSAMAARDVSVSLEKLGDFLALRGLPGDAEQALKHYQRSLTVRERLLAANPESAMAARDVSVIVERLGDFLAQRGLPGDAEQALKHYQRSLTVSEGLLAANPDSAMAARDLMISIEGMARMRAQQGDAAGALVEQERALGMARRLWEHSQSWAMGRTLAVSSLFSGQYAGMAGDVDKAAQRIGECFAILDAFVRAGTQVDAPMRLLHAQLAPMFAAGQ